jgi:glycosyltransferase involved in cell wall biosynthesis
MQMNISEAVKPGNRQRQMNLLFLNAGTDIGGTETMLLRFLERLNKDKFKASVAAFFDRGPLLHEVRKRGSEAVLFAVKHQWNPLEIVYAFARLHSYMKTRKIDILHMYGFYTNILGSITARMAKTPVIITGVRTEISGRNGYHNILEWISDNWIDLYISVSEQSRLQMLARQWVNKEKVVVIHNGIDPGWAHSVGESENRKRESKKRSIPQTILSNAHAHNGGPRIGMIGAFNRLKAQEILVLAAPRVLKKFPNTKFVLMGGGKTRNRIINLITKTRLSKRFVLPDPLIDPRHILPQLDIFVLATRTEGLPVSILEAMAFGLPVIASKVGGIPEIVQDGITGILIPPGKPEALASAIIHLLERPAEAREMGKQGRTRIECDFNIGRMMGELENRYQCLAQSKGIL